MALTKHEKLARGIKRLCEDFEVHYQKTALLLNALQFHFYEIYWIVGRPRMSKQTLQVMGRTHLCGMQLLSSNPVLQSAAQHFPFIGCVLTPPVNLRSRVLELPPLDASKKEKMIIPWGVKIILPAESLRKLEEAKLEALLYSASMDEMSEWIDWFEPEDKTTSLTNQLLIERKNLLTREAFKQNIQKPAVPYYKIAVQQYHQLPKNEPISKALLHADFAPQKDNNIETAFRLVSESLADHRNRHFQDFQRFWYHKLINLMFDGVSCEASLRHSLLVEYFPFFTVKHKTIENPRWQTSSAIDRQTYSAFIRYFSDLFIVAPSKRQAEGEIALLLRIMIYTAHDLESHISIKKLLTLTTSNVSDQGIIIDGREIELSRGLTDLIREYIGVGNLERQQKLFPNLTIDRFEDHLRRASEKILPSGSMIVLPEAFLTFPHSFKNDRISAKSRLEQLKNSSKILHEAISWRKLKQQLVEESKLHFS